MSPNYPVHKTEKTTKDYNEECHDKFNDVGKKENENQKGIVLMSSIIITTTPAVLMQIKIMGVLMQMVTHTQRLNQRMLTKMAIKVRDTIL